MKHLIFAIMATATLCGCASTPKEQSNPPKVYMTTDISAEGLVKVYDALGVEPQGNVAVKISTGEPHGQRSWACPQNHLR